MKRSTACRAGCRPDVVPVRRRRGRRAESPPRAARSVHLGYAGPKADLFYNELTVEKSVPGSYFMACGFRQGYFGIQEQAHGRKVVLFSVWDPGKGDNPNQVPEKERVEVLYHADDVVARRFGGEGTGGQSFFDMPGKSAETYRFLVKAADRREQDLVRRLFLLAGKEDVETPGHLPHHHRRHAAGVASIRSSRIFAATARSANEVRRAVFGNGWVGDADGAWTAAGKGPLHGLGRVVGGQRHNRRRGGEGSFLSANRRRHARHHETE